MWSLSSGIRSVSLGHAFAFTAFILFGCTSLIVKPSTLSVEQMVCLRMLITAACALIASLILGNLKAVALSRRAILAAVGTSTVIFLNMICLFHSFRMAPISVCVALFYVGPVFTLVVRKIIDKEKFSGIDRMAIFLALGAIGILGADFGSHEFSTTLLRGYALAFCGGILFGLVPIFEKGCAAISPSVALLIQSLFAGLCLVPFASFPALSLGLTEIRDVAILGFLFTFLPFLLWWQATRASSRISPFVVYADPVTAALIGVFIFSERLTPFQMLGALLMGAVAVSHVWLTAKAAKKGRADHE